ncbi:class I SAM-dependent methyltransferase [bacterium AH-315-J21]|nr:class I SAM-dependent methyltransferase [bacterium AH-315-J21]
MTTEQRTFDPVNYKKTTHQQWESAAGAWHKWGPLLNSWLGPATETMLDMAGIVEGSRVLDVAAGAGEQSITIGQRVGPSGHVLATDLSPTILQFAAQSAKEAKLENIETRVLDGENLTELDGGSFDAVISRVGMIYFPDQQKALKGMMHTLKEGGKIAAMVYSTAEKNAFFSIPVSIIRRNANLPAPLPQQPGPFSLGGDGVLEAAFQKAGLKNIEVQVVDAPLRVKSVTECIDFEKESFGALHQMMSGLSESQQGDTWEEIEQELRKFESDGGFEGPCELVVASGVK